MLPLVSQHPAPHSHLQQLITLERRAGWMLGRWTGPRVPGSFGTMVGSQQAGWFTHVLRGLR